MRTTFDLPDEVLRAAKKRAADEGVPLREIVERALRAFLNGGGAEVEPYRLQWRPGPRGRLVADIDIDSRKSLYEFFDREDPTFRRELGSDWSDARRDHDEDPLPPDLRESESEP